MPFAPNVYGLRSITKSATAAAGSAVLFLFAFEHDEVIARQVCPGRANQFDVFPVRFVIRVADVREHFIDQDIIIGNRHRGHVAASDRRAAGKRHQHRLQPFQVVSPLIVTSIVANASIGRKIERLRRGNRDEVAGVGRVRAAGCDRVIDARGAGNIAQSSHIDLRDSRPRVPFGLGDRRCSRFGSRAVAAGACEVDDQQRPTRNVRIVRAEIPTVRGGTFNQPAKVVRTCGPIL